MITEDKRGTGQGFWKGHSDAWKASGITQAAYCAQHGISYQGFVYQHNRMARKVKRTAVKFVEAKPEKATVNSQTAGLQLMLPNGIRVGIANDVNAELLKAVLAIAGSLPC